MAEEAPTQDLEHLNRTYRVSRKIVRFVGGNFFGLHVHGVDNIPPDEGALLAANHRGEAEIFGFPAAENTRHVTMISKYELLSVPLLGYYLRLLGAIPVHRGGPTRDEFAEMIAVPESGRIEASFPEGTRSKSRKKALEHADLGEFQPGFARIARKAGVLTVPTALYGMDRLWTSYRVVAFGSPMDPPVNRGEEPKWTEELKKRVEILYSAAHNRSLDVDRIRW